jgi:predicted PurR-regulated permease PerM
VKNPKREVTTQATRKTNPGTLGGRSRHDREPPSEYLLHNGGRRPVPGRGLWARGAHKSLAAPGRGGSLHVSLQAWLALLALGLALWLIARHTSLIFEVSAVLFGAVLLDVAIRPLADRLASRQVPRWITVLAVYFLAAAVLVGLASSLRPLIVIELAQWRTQGPELLQRALNVVGSIPLINEWVPPDSTLGHEIAARLGLLGVPALSILAGVGGLLLDAAVVLALAFFLATDTELSRRFMFAWVPPERRSQFVGFMDDLSQRLARWVWAQIGIALYFAVTYSLGLTILRVPFALTIGVVGGVLEIIPYVGGFIALLLAVLSALTVYPLLGLWVVVLHVVVVFVESHFIAPTFFGRVIGLHPAIVLIALVAGAKAAGVVGVLFAVPVAVVLASFVQQAQGALAQARTAPDEAALAEEKELSS